jgi:hypothetical protein
LALLISNTNVSDNKPNSGTGIRIAPSAAATTKGTLDRVTLNNNYSGVIISGDNSTAVGHFAVSIGIVNSVFTNNPYAVKVQSDSAATRVVARDSFLSEGYTAFTVSTNNANTNFLPELYLAHITVSSFGTGVSNTNARAYSYGDNDFANLTLTNSGAFTQISKN